LLQDNFHHTVSLLLTVWNADTAALLTGRFVRTFRLASFYHRGGKKKKGGMAGYPSGTSAGASGYGRMASGIGSISDEPEWLRRVSPGKSLVGLIGGVVGGTLTFASLPLFWNFVRGFNLVPTSALQEEVPMLVRQQQEPLSSVGGVESGFRVVLDLLWDPDTTPIMLGIGLSLSVAAVLGDLWESAVKRKYGAKDVGRLLPGHGGVLDRFDSSLLAVLLYQYYVEQGIL